MYIGMTVLVVGMGIIFTLMMLLSDKEMPIFGMLALISWFVSAGSVATTEVPYIYYVDNAGTYVATEGIQQITGTAPLTYFFMGLGMLCFVYLFIMAFRAIAEKFRGRIP